MKKINLFLLFLFAMSLSCTNHNRETKLSADTHILKVTFHKQMPNVENVPMSSFVDSISYIKLETTEENLIGEVSDIEYVNHKFYILDMISKSIYIFSDSGKFIDKVAKRGQGPEDYLFLTAYDINSKDNSIHIYDEAAKKMLVYNEKGRLLKSFHVNDFVKDFVVFPNGEYLFYSPLYYSGGYRRGLWRADSEGKFKEQLVSIDDDFKYGGLYPKYFCRINDTTAGLMGGEDVNGFYRITEHSFQIPYQLDVDIQISAPLMRKEAFNFEKYAGKIYTKRNYVETENYLMFMITDFKKGIGILYDKKDNILLSPKDLINDIDGVNHPGRLIGATNGKWILAHTQLSNSKESKVNIPETTEAENPILQILHIK